MQGPEAESRALDYLLRHGLRLVARNYRCRGGELDLVMDDGESIVVVEVRSRGRSDFGTAAESVGSRKQARLIHATRTLLARQPALAERTIRFDVVALDGAGDIQWLRDAFDTAR